MAGTRPPVGPHIARPGRRPLLSRRGGTVPDWGMRLSVELSASLEAQLSAVAARLNVTAEELAAAFLRDLLQEPSADFDAAATRVLEANRELYRRLA